MKEEMGSSMMSSNSDATIVPAPNTVFFREWMLIFTAFLAAAFVWFFIAFEDSNTTSSATNKIAYQQGSTKELEVTFLDVGEGDCAFIQTPNGHTALIDAGPGKGKYSRFDAGEKVVLPFLISKGITHVDTLMMTHPHADHYGGMIPVMDAIEIGEFLDPGLDFPSRGYEKLLLKVEEKNIPYRIIQAPKILSWDPKVFVQILWPEQGSQRPKDPNNNSIVFRLVYSDIVYFFSGDMEIPVERNMYAYGEQLKTTILKIPHHGSDTSSTRILLNLLKPRLAVFSCGYNNRFGHPDLTIIERYNDLKIRTLRTDKHGSITTLCNGSRVKVTPKYGSPFTIYPFPAMLPGTEH